MVCDGLTIAAKVLSGMEGWIAERVMFWDVQTDRSVW